MEFEQDELFDKYIEAFKKLPLKEKKEITIKKIQKLLSYVDKLNETINNPNKILYNKEIQDIKKTNSTEDDFIEAVLVYIHSIEESLANYIDKIGG